MSHPGANYVGQMDFIVNGINREPRIVQCIQCYNEKDFIGYTLRSIYNEVDRIIVIDGAVKNRMENNAHQSTDGTIDIIRAFIKNHDPDGKVSFIQKDRAYESLEELKQTFLTAVSDGDWILINDADEFYQPEDIRRLRRAIDYKPTATEFIPLFLNYWRDWGHVRCARFDSVVQHQRFFRYQRGMTYQSHPVVLDPQGMDTCLDPRYQPKRYIMNNFYIHHFGMARPNMDEVMKSKLDYYQKELKALNADKEFEQKTQEFLEGKEDVDFLATIGRRQIPTVLRDHPMFKYSDPFYQDKHPQMIWETSPYKEFQEGEAFGTVYAWMHGKNPKYQLFHNEVNIPVEEDALCDYNIVTGIM